MKIIAPRSEKETNVSKFCPSRDIQKLALKFDINKLKQGLEDVIKIVNYEKTMVNAICLTQIKGDNNSYTGGNLRGLFWTRPNSDYQELQREKPINEAAYNQFIASLAHTYFKYVYDKLSEFFTLGRVRLLKILPRASLSWHRDPEPRIHIPIITNPGAIMLVNNHGTHMPADGSVYFTDTTYYHSAFNGGEDARVNLTASVVKIAPQIKKYLTQNY